MAEDSGQTVLAALFDHILPLAPELPGRLESGISVLDLGCGRGKALLALADRYPRSDLTDDGVYLAEDTRAHSHHHENVDHPLGGFLSALSVMHCMTVSLAQGGEGLGTMWGREKALEYMQAAGFADVQVHELAHDLQNDYFVCRPGSWPWCWSFNHVPARVSGHGTHRLRHRKPHGRMAAQSSVPSRRCDVAGNIEHFYN